MYSILTSPRIVWVVTFFCDRGVLGPKAFAHPEMKPESKEWCSKLKQAAIRARGLDPGMRSYTLLLASRGLQKCAPQHEQQRIGRVRIDRRTLPVVRRKF